MLTYTVHVTVLIFQLNIIKLNYELGESLCNNIEEERKLYNNSVL